MASYRPPGRHRLDPLYWTPPLGGSQPTDTTPWTDLFLLNPHGGAALRLLSDVESGGGTQERHAVAEPCEDAR